MPEPMTLLLSIGLAVVVLLTGSTLASWLTGVMRTRLESTGLDPAIRRLAVGSVRPAVLVLAFMAGLNLLGIELTGLAAMLGAATLAIGMALKSSLSNVASGAILLSLRPYREGDNVVLAGNAGIVVEQGLYVTVLQTPQGLLVTLPNDLILRAPIQNVSRHGLRRIDLDLTLPFEADVAAALGAAKVALQAHEKVLADPAPVALVADLNARGLVLSARGWVKAGDFAATKSDLAQSVVAAVRASGAHLEPLTLVVGERG